MSEEKENSNKKRGIILWIIIILLMGTNGYTIWLLYKEQNT
jgi:flagellar basal body-associated protein FliL